MAPTTGRRSFNWKKEMLQERFVHASALSVSGKGGLPVPATSMVSYQFRDGLIDNNNFS